MNEPRDHNSPAKAVRASDSERERVATLVGDAAGAGRLTLAEVEERLERIYTTRFRHELDELVADLPTPHDDRPRPERTGGRGVPTRLRVHAAVAVVLSVFLILRWVASDAPFFWPAGPMFFLFGSLVMHARLVIWSSRGRAPGFRRWELTPSGTQRYGDPTTASDGRDTGQGRGVRA
ncbi:DUF1707 SHOCT-like domain-containing protein [Actinophytocola sp.]|uniref:DUF1707 SHOCT-like domain-containing protein n=1 Tax=Actinophytocola sp. TaxID=1872138 RepID=UPI003D6B1DB5